jgi:hypothetical protein
MRAEDMAYNASLINAPLDPLDCGFDFSLDEMRAFGEANFPHYQITRKNLNFHTWLAEHRAAQKAA